MTFVIIMTAVILILTTLKMLYLLHKTYMLLLEGRIRKTDFVTRISPAEEVLLNQCAS